MVSTKQLKDRCRSQWYGWLRKKPCKKIKNNNTLVDAEAMDCICNPDAYLTENEIAQFAAADLVAA